MRCYKTLPGCSRAIVLEGRAGSVQSGGPDRLTARELGKLGMFARGRSYAQIAKARGDSNPTTVRNALYGIQERLRLAIRQGLAPATACPTTICCERGNWLAGWGNDAGGMTLGDLRSDLALTPMGALRWEGTRPGVLRLYRLSYNHAGNHPQPLRVFIPYQPFCPAFVAFILLSNLRPLRCVSGLPIQLPGKIWKPKLHCEPSLPPPPSAGWFPRR